VKSSVLRAGIGLFFISAGLFVILGASFFLITTALDNYLAANPVYLTSDAEISAGPRATAIELAQADTADRIAAGLELPEISTPDPNLPTAGDPYLQPSPSPFPTGSPDGVQITLARPPTATTASKNKAYANSTESISDQSTLEPVTSTPFPFEVSSEPTPTAVLTATANLEPTLDTQSTPAWPTPELEPTLTASPTPELIQPQPVYRGPDPIVRLVISRLKVKRAVVEIGVVDPRSGGMEWDTDRLFDTQNRPDLIGHLEGSANPGESGNIVLVGHNYTYTGNGVFVNLQKLETGDKITVYTESGQELVYQVTKVKLVPYSGDGSELERHLRFLDPTPEERLTLVTCGGANIGFFNKRVYVVAEPVNPQ
jgi:LPXTG-site transpeptidase (sortase) family protein